MLKGWRTLILNTAVAAIGVAQTFGWATVIPAPWVGPVMLGLGVVGNILRTLTTGPVGTKQ